MGSTSTDNAELDPRRRAFAHFDAVARSTVHVSVATRLHCLAAADDLGGSHAAVASTTTVTDRGDVETQIRAALADLGSLPLEEFVSVRTAARNGRRALRSLR